MYSLLKEEDRKTVPDQITLRDVVGFFPEWRKGMSEDTLYTVTVLHSVALWCLWGECLDFDLLWCKVAVLDETCTWRREYCRT